jgi:membrane-associated phospholipid phosphatase
MRNLLLSILSFLLILPCSAQVASDTLAVKSNFKAGELIVPLSLIGVGSLGFVEPIKSGFEDFQYSLNSWCGDHRTTVVDDYLQYVPLASVYGFSLLGADAKHNYVDRTLEVGTACVALVGIVGGAKYLIDKERPDGSDFNSFPSGHSAKAFMGAELVRIEYGEEHPWLAVGAYTIASTVGVLRVYNDRHWFTDVFAGAGVGILSARIGYWLLPYTKRVMHRITGCDVFLSPVASPEGASLNAVVKF